MSELRQFQPKLVGTLLGGVVDCNTVVTLHLFADSIEEVAWALMERRIDHRNSEHLLRMSTGEVEHIPGFSFIAGEVPIELLVFSGRSRRHTPISSLDGRAMERASLSKVRAYNSMGSSSWIAIASKKPVLNERSRPYVFAHAIPGMFVSATAIFSAGSSFKWVRDRFCPEIIEQAKKENMDEFELMAQVAKEAGPGSNGILFNPSLAGGSFLDESPEIRGGFIGLELGHEKSDIIRATMEGISLGLTLALDELKKLTRLNDEMIVVGGGSKNSFWRQIYADMYDMKIIKTSVDQQAATLGAAALAAVGTGLWKDFKQIDEAHKIESVTTPDPDTREVYRSIKSVYRKAGKYLADLGIELAKIRRNDK